MPFSALHFFRLAAVVLFLATALARAQETISVDNVVALPPFLVDEAATGPHWRYAQTAEFEILSRCSDATTSELAQSYHRLHRLLELVLPARFQVKLDVPKTLVLYDEALLPATAQEMFAAASQSGPPVLGLSQDPRSILRSPRLNDLDVMTVFASVPYAPDDGKRRRAVQPGSGQADTVAFRPSGMFLTPSYVAYLLGNRVPALPAWFVTGFLSTYQKMNFSDDTVALGTMEWLSPKETRAIKSQPENQSPASGVKLLPMAEFLAGPGANAEHTQIWFAQAELFYRWAVNDPVHPRREAFWTFVERASGSPPDEAMFKACFGEGFAWANEQLGIFLKTAVRKSVTFRSAEPIHKQAVAVRDATAGEIARIKGDWERLANDYVRVNLPELETKYLGHARRTLRRAYDAGDRDPRLLAIMGLCESDAGNVGEARILLELAVQGAVVRPRAYLELGRLRFAEQRERAAGAEGKLSAEQTDRVLAPLLAGRKQAPALPDGFELIADVWTASAAKPQRADLAVLDEGLALFPQRAELLYRTAMLYAASGFISEAAKLAATGVRNATDETTRMRFVELKVRLGGR